MFSLCFFMLDLFPTFKKKIVVLASEPVGGIAFAFAISDCGIVFGHMENAGLGCLKLSFFISCCCCWIPLACIQTAKNGSRIF